MKPLIIFDYDGTIHNTFPIYKKAIYSICDIYHFEYPRDEQIRTWLGMSPEAMWLDFHPELEKRIVQKVSVEVGQFMCEQISDAKWYDGIEEQLDWLSKKYTLIVLSNCSCLYGKSHWQHFQMYKWFDCFYAAEEFHYQSKEEIIRQLLKKYNVNAGVGLGDRKHDIEAYKKNGLYSIGIQYGFGSKEDCEMADLCIENVDEIGVSVDSGIKENKALQMAEDLLLYSSKEMES